MALSIDEGDWIPVWRKIRDNWVWRDGDDLKAWLDLLMMANWRESKFKFRGHIHPILRGQVAATYSSLAKRNRWSRDKVKGFLQCCIDDNSLRVDRRAFDTKTGTWIDSTSDSGFLVLTIINYPVTSEAASKPSGESTPKPAGDRQGLVREPTHPRREEGKKERKEGRAGAGAPPPAEPASERIQKLIEYAEAMTPTQARTAMEHDDRWDPKVLEILKRKAAEVPA